MPRQFIVAEDIGEVVRKIIRYLEDSNAPYSIYYDGWGGLGASAVLRAIAQDPPSSLMKKFSKIIHIDCSKWKSRRELQRTIAQELELPQEVMAFFDRQDEEDDFSGIDEGSRAEIGYVGRKILRVLMEHRCLVVFHNGSNNMVDFSGFGIPQPELFGTIVLWTFRGRLRLNPGIIKKVDNSHLYLHNYVHISTNWNLLLQEEVSEIARYTCKLGAFPKIAEECCLYLLSLNNNGGGIMDYDWVTHASNYWVCDGIIQEGGQFDQAWEIAVALHQEIHLEDYSSNTQSDFGRRLRTPRERWIFATKSAVEDSVTLPRQSTSFFFVNKSGSDPPLASLPNGMFHQSDMLRVLRLCRCTFNFSSPPFHRCRNLRFLGLDLCKDQPQAEDEKKEIAEMDYVQSLWVVDICNTDWELAQSPEIIEQMFAKIREVHIKKGRFWHHNFAWGKLQNLLKLRVIEPICPWETREMDGFTDMLKLEFLDLSRNTAIQVLPRLYGAASLKTLLLDGCVGLEHIEDLPPSLESFSFVVGEAEKITHISMAGCARMVEFTLCGSFPRLEELDLSGTKIKTLDLKDQVVQVPHLQRVMMLGCEQLCAVLWPEKGMPHLSVLCIDTRGGGGAEVRRIVSDSKKLTYFLSYVAMMDMRFIQSLVLRSCSRFCWNTNRLNLHLCISATSMDGGQSYNKEKMGPASVEKVIGSPLPKLSILNPSYRIYTDVAIDNITIDPNYNSAPKFQSFGRCHVEIGKEISNTNVESVQGIKPIIFVMNEAESLHVHDNSSITTVIPQHMMSIGVEREIFWRRLKQCLVERCPKLHTVFNTNYNIVCFRELETFWAADLPMAHCIWSKGSTDAEEDTDTFAKLQSIHLYSCPRLTFILPLSWFYTLSSLETIHIVNCGHLRQVFPVEIEFLRRIATDHQDGILEFPKLKNIYLHELYELHHICEAKMFAPKLEKVRLRGCWGLRRLPAIGQDSRPVVYCEKDWWEKLEWDGLEAGHHPSLFKPCHSSYYKKPLPRVSVLR